MTGNDYWWQPSPADYFGLANDFNQMLKILNQITGLPLIEHHHSSLSHLDSNILCWLLWNWKDKGQRVDIFSYFCLSYYFALLHLLYCKNTVLGASALECEAMACCRSGGSKVTLRGQITVFCQGSAETGPPSWKSLCAPRLITQSVAGTQFLEPRY